MFKNVWEALYRHGNSITLNDVTMVDFYSFCLYFLIFL